MITLGLDPSLTGFGWCIHNSSALGADRVVARGRFHTSPRTLWIKRYVDLRESVHALLQSYLLVEAVGVESPPFGAQYSEGLFALFFAVNEAVWNNHRDVVYFDPVTLKMLTKEDPSTRKGKMFKSDMIDAAVADTGVGKWTSDEADAYHAARYAARFWMLLNGQIRESDLTPAEHRAFVRVHTFTKGKKAGQTVRSGAVFKENLRFFRFSKSEESTP